jgi:hypothetical protein
VDGVLVAFGQHCLILPWRDLLAGPVLRVSWARRDAGVNASRKENHDKYRNEQGLGRGSQ